MCKESLERCSAVFTKVSLKNQRLFHKSAEYLKHSRTSATEISCENSQRFSAANYFRKKAPS